MKQQYLPPQQQTLRQQLHTNGIGGMDNSNNSSRTASPAMTQPLNSAYLPPTSQTIRPNVYGNHLSTSNPPPPTINQLVQSNRMFFCILHLFLCLIFSK